MDKPHFFHEHLTKVGHFSQPDFKVINECRGKHNRLGFSYQLVFVKFFNRFPRQQPFEVDLEILTFVSAHLEFNSKQIDTYQKRQQTISDHQERIRNYLGLAKYGKLEAQKLKQLLFDEAGKHEQLAVICQKAEEYLINQKVIHPGKYTLQRLATTQREKARQYIFNRITEMLTQEAKDELDGLLVVNEGSRSQLQSLKDPPGKPSVTALEVLSQRLEAIEKTTVFHLNLDWLNNNYQRSLSFYVRNCSADRLRQLTSEHRYAGLVCFLAQTHKDTVDHLVAMYDKLINRVDTQAERKLDEHIKNKHRQLKKLWVNLVGLGETMIDETIPDTLLRLQFFKSINKEEFTNQLSAAKSFLSGKYSHKFDLIAERYSYLRQITPKVLKHVSFDVESKDKQSVVKAISLLDAIGQSRKQTLADMPSDFLPKQIQSRITNKDGSVDRKSYYSAVVMAIRDEVKSGNLAVQGSKRFGKIDTFFIPQPQWQARKKTFFKRAGLPENPENVPEYLTNRLNAAYDYFLEHQPENQYAKVSKDGWILSVDPGEQLSLEHKQKLFELKSWLTDNMRTIKLPNLLIEVNNHLHFTQSLMTQSQIQKKEVDDVVKLIATIMAHGCNVGAYTMAQLTPGISYSQIKRVTDWQLTEDAQREALAKVVNAISNLEVTDNWGDGTTSSSDGQRFSLRRKVLQQTYSHKFNDFALEFYSFVADNYAPFYITPIECTDRDAPYVLDGLLYNKSDLPLKEHYTDTHGYTDINFAAFVMLGRKFSPRIRGLHRKSLFIADTQKDYGVLEPLIRKPNNRIHLDWIADQWDRIAHFYASFETGHTSVPTALKRLAGFSKKNHFYRANRDLGRVFTTEHVLTYMTDPAQRIRTRRGLLKGEQMNALARDVRYGKRGRITTGDLHSQKMSANCLILIMACIIYWQAKEMSRIIMECEPETSGIDLSLLEHVSPVGWDNVILYGEYVIDKNLVKTV